jgi:hypothetical protein
MSSITNHGSHSCSTESMYPIASIQKDLDNRDLSQSPPAFVDFLQKASQSLADLSAKVSNIHSPLHQMQSLVEVDNLIKRCTEKVLSVLRESDNYLTFFHLSEDPSSRSDTPIARLQTLIEQLIPLTASEEDKHSLNCYLSSIIEKKPIYTAFLIGKKLQKIESSEDARSLFAQIHPSVLTKIFRIDETHGKLNDTFIFTSNSCELFEIDNENASEHLADLILKNYTLKQILEMVSNYASQYDPLSLDYPDRLDNPKNGFFSCLPPALFKEICALLPEEDQCMLALTNRPLQYHISKYIHPFPSSKQMPLNDKSKRERLLFASILYMPHFEKLDNDIDSIVKQHNEHGDILGVYHNRLFFQVPFQKGVSPSMKFIDLDTKKCHSFPLKHSCKAMTENDANQIIVVSVKGCIDFYTYQSVGIYSYDKSIQSLKMSKVEKITKIEDTLVVLCKEKRIHLLNTNNDLEIIKEVKIDAEKEHSASLALYFKTKGVWASHFGPYLIFVDSQRSKYCLTVSNSHEFSFSYEFYMEKDFYSHQFIQNIIIKNGHMHVVTPEKVHTFRVTQRAFPPRVPTTDPKENSNLAPPQKKQRI